MSISLLIEPIDTLALRGNRLFGDPGSYGEALMPPWPSVAAGAIRSWMLAAEGVDLAAFAAGQVPHPTLGTPAQPGSFALAAFHLARRRPDGVVELLYAPPADLDITQAADGTQTVRRMKPTTLHQALACSASLHQVPALAQDGRAKPVAGRWLSTQGWRAYLRGQAVEPGHLLNSSDLWQFDHRVGLAIDAALGRADDGKLFSLNAVVMRPGVGFAAWVAGAQPPAKGMLRLGGDGRGAQVQQAEIAWPQPDFKAIADAGKARLVLTSPGVFQQGWLPTGTTRRDADTLGFDLHGISGRLVAACVPRAEVVSGFDLAQWQPKPAQRAAPTGSVYWLDQLEAKPDALRSLADTGLWADTQPHDPRCAEGFNRFSFAAY